MQLSHEDVLELLGYRESSRREAEILGFEYSDRGIQACLRERDGIESGILNVIVNELRATGCFPAMYAGTPTAVGTWIEESSCVVIADKPGIWTKQWYATPKAAALALIRLRLNQTWWSNARVEQPIREERSW